MENLVLKMHYMGKSVDVRVDDTDKCLLIDVYNDMYDEADKHGVPLPKHPSLGYSFKMEHVHLREDKDLMTMFERVGYKKEIDIWLGSETIPCNTLQLARTVRACNKEGRPVEQVFISADKYVPVREKLPFKRNSSQPKPQPKFQIDHTLTTSPPKTQEPATIIGSTSPRRSCRLNAAISPAKSQEPFENLTSITPTQSPVKSQAIIMLSASPRRSPRLNSTLSKQPSTVTHSQLTQVTQSRIKIPKTTALRKGIYVSNVQSQRSNLGEGSSRRSMRIVRNHYDNISDDSETDGSYMPSDEEVGDDGGLSDLEVEDSIVLSSLQVDDGYIPFQNHEWSGEENSYAGQVCENGEVFDAQEFGAIKIRPWMLFMDKDHFKDVLRDYCIQEGFTVVVVKADNKRYTADCATMTCQWRIHASVLPDGTTWAIKSIRNPQHGCAGVKRNNPMANCVWVANKMIEDIRANQAISAQSIKDLLMERYGIEMATSSVYKMKDIALREINGSHDESYSQLPAYCEVIKATNPGSVAICAWVHKDSPERPLQFKSIFISFQAQSEGLIRGCRSLIGVDGTHLKGNYGGVLLSAVALDANGELFPVAVAVVESENKDSWSYFFWHLKQIVKNSGRNNWTIISDRQKGVEPALDSIWPESYRRFCARHLCKNFKTEFPGLLMHQLFWRVVDATSEYTFKSALELVVQHAGLRGARWFLDLGEKEMWARHKFDPSLSSDDNTSNFVESFNATIGVHRCNPVLSMLEGIRRMAMVRHAARQHTAEYWPDDGICPNIVERLKVLTKDSRPCHAYNSGPGKYEVSEGRAYYPVSLIERTCQCGGWQISGIPCRHAIRAIITADKEPCDFVNEWFSVRMYKEAYGLSMNPMPDKEQWQTYDVPTLEPPTLRRAIGRPSRNRRREPGEARKGKRSASIKCKKCGCFGHNSKTCKGGYTAKQRQELQGKVTKKRAKQGLSSSLTKQFHSLHDLETTVMSSQASIATSQEGTSKGKKRKTT